MTEHLRQPDDSRGPRRVLHVITSLATGGAEAMLTKLVGGSSTLGWESLVICLGNDGPMGTKIRGAGASVLVLDLSWRRPSLDRIWAAAKTARAWEPSIVQGWMYHGNVAASLLRPFLRRSAALLWNIRCTLTSRADFPAFTRCIIRISAFLSNGPTAVIFNSKTAVTQHIAHGFRMRRAIVISNGFELERFAPDPVARAAVRARLEIESHGVLIGMIARYHPMKDFPNLIAALSGVLRRHPRARVVLAGPGVGDNAELERLIMGVGIRDRVVREGEYAEPEHVLPALDLFCLSSAWGEAFPNIVGEAMACGVPCVATDVGDTAHIVAATGRIVPPRDSRALEEALSEMVALPVAVREACGLAARKRIESNYDIRAIVREYCELYETLRS